MEERDYGSDSMISVRYGEETWGWWESRAGGVSERVREEVAYGVDER